MTWENWIVEHVARRRCVIFLGAGVSMNSHNASGIRPKSWKEFLEASLLQISSRTAHIKKLIKDNDYLTACDIIKKKLGSNDFIDLVQREFLTPGFQPAKIHETIFKLDSRIVVTPNFDKIYETYTATQTNGTVITKNHYDSDVGSVIREFGRVILKIHGTIDTPLKMIFTRHEYAKARSEYSNFYEILEALSLTNTFIFIGSGINDPDIRLLLEDTFFKHKSSKPHIMLLPKTLHSDVKIAIEESTNLKIKEYSPKNNHQELLDSLEDLSKQVELKKQELATSMNW